MLKLKFDQPGIGIPGIGRGTGTGTGYPGGIIGGRMIGGANKDVTRTSESIQRSIVPYLKLLQREPQKAAHLAERNPEASVAQGNLAAA